MNNNDILRRIRYTFAFSDEAMIKLFALGQMEVTRAQVSDWLKKDDNPEQVTLNDKELATFLNGLIIKNRGMKEGQPPKPEKRLNNNIILRKLKIALQLKDDGILEIMDLANLAISRHELSAFFRKPEQSQYRKCKDQFLRNFLYGLQLKYQGDTSSNAME